MADTDALAPVPTVRSLKQWGVAKETRAGKITVTMTLTDPAEAGAWAVWLLDHEPGLIPRRPAISCARARARPRGVNNLIGCGKPNVIARACREPRTAAG